MSTMELALGTVQFGQKYGISGADMPPSDKELKYILAKAWEYGIRILDTAPSYGTIEERLPNLMSNYSFSIVSKIPSINFTKLYEESEVKQYIEKNVSKTNSRLGDRLSTLLFHQSTDLLNPYGARIWETVTNTVSDPAIQIGISCYTPQEFIEINHHYGITVAQIPVNAFDQRFFNKTEHLEAVEIHIRSVFLQGLLLLTAQEVASKLPHALRYCSMWQKWCQEKGLSPLEASLSIAKGLSPARYCVVGVDNLQQLDEVCLAWANAKAISAPELALEIQEVIDPRCWNSPEKIELDLQCT